MATINFHVTEYGRKKGNGAATLAATDFRASGQDIITTVENLEDASGDITVYPGEVLVLHSTAAMRFRVDGVAATSTTGVYLPADAQREYEVSAESTVSMVEAV